MRCAATDDDLASPGDDAVGLVCGHDPAEVARTARGRLYPAAWFFRFAGPRFDLGGLRLFVSVGAADTVPFRWNCPREALLCDLDGDGGQAR